MKIALHWLNQELNGEISAYTAAPLVADGHTVLVVHYDRAPKQQLQDIINQVKSYSINLLKNVPIQGGSYALPDWLI